jgi:hypothetical protein
MKPMNKFVSATMLRQKPGYNLYSNSSFERPMYLKTTSKCSLESTATESDNLQDFPELFESSLSPVQSITTEKLYLPAPKALVAFNESELERRIPHLSRDDYTAEEKRACFVGHEERKIAYSKAKATSRMAVPCSHTTSRGHPLHSVCNHAAKIAWASNRTSKRCQDVVSSSCQNEDTLDCVRSLTEWLALQSENGECRGLEKFIRNLAEFHPQGQLDARSREMMQNRRRIVHASKEGLSSATIAALCRRLTCSDVAVARLFALSDAIVAAAD